MALFELRSLFYSASTRLSSLKREAGSGGGGDSGWAAGVTAGLPQGRKGPHSKRREVTAIAGSAIGVTTTATEINGLLLGGGRGLTAAEEGRGPSHFAIRKKETR